MLMAEYLHSKLIDNYRYGSIKKNHVQHFRRCGDLLENSGLMDNYFIVGEYR